MEEVGDLSHSPPPVRRGKGRKSNQTPQASKETRKASRTTKSVIDELEWSAPSSPASEDSKPASETSAAGNLDPSLWQDYGSAFHTAFSLLGGGEDFPLVMSESGATPDILGPSDVMEPTPPQDTETEAADNSDSSDEMEISQPAVPESVAGEEIDDVVLISSQEEDSDEMTLLQIKEQVTAKSRQVNTGARGGRGGRGKARGRGRGRGKGKGRGKGRGRGRAVELLSTIADQDDDLVFVGPSEQHGERPNDSHSLSEMERSPVHFNISLSPAERSSSDCIILDTDLDHITDVTPGQYDDAPEKEEEEKTKDDENVKERSGASVSDGHDSDTLYCICRQKQDKR